MLIIIQPMVSDCLCIHLFLFILVLLTFQAGERGKKSVLRSCILKMYAFFQGWILHSLSIKLEIKLEKKILTYFVQNNHLLIRLNVLSTSRPIYQEISSLILNCHILESTSRVPSPIIFDVILASCEIFFPLHEIFHQLNVDNVTCQTRNENSPDSSRPTYLEVFQYRKYCVSLEAVLPTCQVQFMKETL